MPGNSRANTYRQSQGATIRDTSRRLPTVAAKVRIVAAKMGVFTRGQLIMACSDFPPEKVDNALKGNLQNGFFKRVSTGLYRVQGHAP